MTINFTQVIKDQDDQPLQDYITMQTNGNKEITLTLGRAVSHSLMTQDQNEQISAEDKFNRGMLAFKIRDCADCEVKAEDIVLMKKQLGKLYSPIVIYRAFPMLDSSENVNGK